MMKRPGGLKRNGIIFRMRLGIGKHRFNRWAKGTRTLEKRDDKEEAEKEDEEKK